MKTESSPAFLDHERIEQISTISLILGVLFIFQWGFQALSTVGLLLLAIGAAGTLAGQVIQRNYLARIVERMAVVGMMVGIAGMLQPWHILLYQNGFYVLAISTLTFIIVSHINSPVAE